MNNKKSYGKDGISNEVFKCCLPGIEPAIAAAFNEFFEERTFPKCLKLAKVIPIFNKPGPAQIGAISKAQK